MVIVKGLIPVRADARESALSLVQTLARRTRSEHGCLSCEVYVQADSPQVIMLWQQWRTLDALEHHFDSDHMDTFLECIPDMIDGEVHSLRFDVTDDGDEPDDASDWSMPTVAKGTVLH